MVVKGDLGSIALAHNGNVLDIPALRDELAEQGVEPRTSTDSELVAHLIARATGDDWASRMRAVLPRLQGAYCRDADQGPHLRGARPIRNPAASARSATWLQREDGSWLIAGSMPVDEMADRLDIAIPQERSYHTAAGFVLDWLGHLPQIAESFDTQAGASKSSISMAGNTPCGWTPASSSLVRPAPARPFAVVVRALLVGRAPLVVGEILEIRTGRQLAALLRKNNAIQFCLLIRRGQAGATHMG